jgi:C-terminal processing protease CtpA/Prc
VYSTLDSGVGLLKVNIFPGIVGIDFARDIDNAIASFGNCRALIIDLRGNSGGGMGGLRLMSYLTPVRLPIGYSLTRNRARKGYKREELRQFDRIPRRKAALLWLALRYGLGDQSIALFTEGLGAQTFHGRVAILVNANTASASEIVAAFAQENGLAKIVGTRSAGRLVASRRLKLHGGYFLSLPVGAYLTWSGKMLEKAGVEPDVPVDVKYEDVVSGRDPQLDAAIAAVSS